MIYAAKDDFNYCLSGLSENRIVDVDSFLKELQCTFCDIVDSSDPSSDDYCIVGEDYLTLQEAYDKFLSSRESLAILRDKFTSWLKGIDRIKSDAKTLGFGLSDCLTDESEKLMDSVGWSSSTMICYDNY